MSDSNILSAAIDAFKQTFTKMCSDLPNTLDTLDEKSFKMMTEVLLNAAGNAGIAGLETFLAESDTVHATITKNVYTARMPEEKSIEFKKEFERMVKTVESKFSGDTGPVYRVLLTDGHLMIKGYAKESAFLRQYEKCLDFYHATEHLSKAADAMYGEKTEFSKAYYAKWRSRLLSVSNAPDAIVRSLVSFQQRTPLTGKRKDELKTEVTFFKKNKKLMKYYNFNKRGLPIGSGPIEAAAKTIVRQRMCRSGMSWSRVKGQYVLTVRSYVKSGLWDEAWEYYVELKKAA